MNCSTAVIELGLVFGVVLVGAAVLSVAGNGKNENLRD